MSEVVKDLFDTTEITMPVSVVEPKKKAKAKTATPPPQVPDPAYRVIKKNSLTETEYSIYNTALEGIENIGSMDEKLLRECNVLRLGLLNVLALKFGYRDAAHAREEGLSFKLKGNFEVELLKKR